MPYLYGTHNRIQVAMGHREDGCCCLPEISSLLTLGLLFYFSLAHLPQLLCGTESLQQLWNLGQAVLTCLFFSALATGTVTCKRSISQVARIPVRLWQNFFSILTKSIKFFLLFSSIVCFSSPRFLELGH